MMGAKSFEQTVKGIKNALETNVHVITNTTLMRSNMGHVIEIIDFLYDLGIRTFAMNGMIYSGGGFAHPNAIPEDELAPLLIQIRDLSAKIALWNPAWGMRDQVRNFNLKELDISVWMFFQNLVS